MNKTFLCMCIFITSCCMTFQVTAQHYEFSSGLYQLPYADLTEIHVFSDVYTHSPRGKYDLLTPASNPTVVAAADGWVRWIQESFDTTCHNGSGNCCWEYNNFVIIEHPNGEWSNYTHMDFQSVSGAGIVLNQWITAGTPIGTEGTVGCSTEDHVHFEVSRPFDVSVPFDTIGGFLNARSSDGSQTPLGEMLIPVIKGIGMMKSYISAGDVVFASSAQDNCPANLNEGSGLGNGQLLVARADASIYTSGSPLIYGAGSTSIFRSGQSVVLRPGFQAQSGSKFHVIIKACNSGY